MFRKQLYSEETDDPTSSSLNTYVALFVSNYLKSLSALYYPMGSRIDRVHPKQSFTTLGGHSSKRWHRLSRCAACGDVIMT